MTLLVDECLRHISHTLDGSPSAKLNPFRIVNGAGRTFSNMRSWRYLDRPEASLDLVANQPWVSLPADLGTIVEITSATTPWLGISIVDFARVSAARSVNSLVASLAYLGGIVYADGISPRIELYPTPLADQVAAFRLAYRATWINVSSNNQSVPIPQYAEDAFIRVLRAYARGYELEDQAPLSAWLEAAMASPEFDAAVACDIGITSETEYVTGGMGQMISEDWEPYLYPNSTTPGV